MKGKTATVVHAGQLRLAHDELHNHLLKDDVETFSDVRKIRTLARQLLSALQSSNLSESSPLFWEARASVAQAIDYTDDVELDTTWLLERGDQQYEFLSRVSQSSRKGQEIESQMALTRSRVRYCAYHAKLKFHNSRDFERAEERFRGLIDIANRLIGEFSVADVPPIEPRLRWFRAWTLIQLQGFAGSSRELERILEFYTTWFRRLNPDQQGVWADYVRRRAAIVQRTVAWMHSVQGETLLAKRHSLFSTLALTGRKGIDYSLSLLTLGSAQRSLAGRDPELLRNSVEHLGEAARVLRELGLPRQEARSQFELGLASLNLGDFRGAKIASNRLIEILGDDRKWGCNAALLDARISMEIDPPQFGEAAGHSVRALDLARGMPDLRIKALIECCRAHTGLGQFSKALRYGQDAVELIGISAEQSDYRANPRLKATAEAYLSLCYSCGRDSLGKQWHEKSKHHLTEAKELQQQIDDRYVREVVQKATLSLDSAGSFRIDAGSSLEYALHERNLRRYLVEQAKARKARSYQEIAEMLKINRQRASLWDRSPEEKPGENPVPDRSTTKSARVRLGKNARIRRPR